MKRCISAHLTSGWHTASEQWAVRAVAAIIQAIPGSPAATAGLKSTRRDPEGKIILGDIIVSVDGKPVKKANDLFEQLKNRKVGDKVKLGLLRDGEEETVEVTLGSVE